MNFTLLQAAPANGGGWSQFIFFVPILAIFLIIKGKTKPLIPTLIFLGFGLFCLISNPFSLYTQNEVENKKVLIGFTLIFFLIGGYFLYKVIEMGNIRRNKKSTSTFESKEDKPQIDIYIQIKNLNDLKEKGIITDEEFKNKKQILLSRI